MAHVLRRPAPPELAALLLAVAVVAAPPPPALAAGPPLRVRVDATEAPRGLLHARLEIPVRPGPVALLYPKWIPGEHGPTGPLEALAGIHVSAGGRAIAWERDLVDMYTIHCRAPAGVSALDVTLDFLLPRQGPHSFAVGATAALLLLSWNQVVLYPEGRPVAEIPVAAWLQLPAGWSYATALAGAKDGSGLIEFAPVSLATLVDSPGLAGEHFRRVDLTPTGGPPVAADLACDSEAGLAASPELVAEWKQLVAETLALFGSRHFRHYDFLVSLSDHVVHDGLEHHESSDDRLPERAFVDDDLRLASAGLLPHEFAHSWNGKYRRPADLLSPDFHAPMRTDLLWVYEGLTSYLDFVLTARSGLVSPERAREELARTAGWLDKRPGRTWRPLQDTADEAQILYGAPEAWATWRRSVDFYDEGVLVWLEADVLIRERTGGKRSLDDFCRLFFGASAGAARGKGAPAGAAPTAVPYVLDDVLKALAQVAPYDWRSFFATRLRSTAPRPPLGGVEGGGWRLVWADTLGPVERAYEKEHEAADLRYSIGVVLDREGTISDVVPGSAAAEAGLGPGMRPLAVNGLRFGTERLREALREGKNGTATLELLAENGEYVRAYRLDWHGGELYPALARDPGKPDRLSDILKPLTPRIAAEKGAGGQ